jgi:hypothetical protein
MYKYMGNKPWQLGFHIIKTSNKLFSVLEGGGLTKCKSLLGILESKTLVDVNILLFKMPTIIFKTFLPWYPKAI